MRTAKTWINSTSGDTEPIPEATAANVIISLRIRIGVQQIVSPNIVISSSPFGGSRYIALHLPNLTRITESGILVNRGEVDTERIEIIFRKILILIGRIALTAAQPTVNNTIRHKGSDSDKSESVKQRALHRIRLNERINFAANTITDIQMTVMRRVRQP